MSLFYFIRKLENFEAAENYCAEIGRPDAYMQSVIFLSFYSLNAGDDTFTMA